jgi:hypothetical protein
VIVTERPVLHTLPPALVALLAVADWEAARATDPPYDISDETFSDDEHVVLLLRRALLAKDPDEEPWPMRVAVLKGTLQVTGLAGFHRRPTPRGSWRSATASRHSSDGRASRSRWRKG